MRHDKALADYTDAIRLNPRFGAANYCRADLDKKAGEAGKAAADLAMAKKLGYDPLTGPDAVYVPARGASHGNEEPEEEGGTRLMSAKARKRPVRGVKGEQGNRA